MLMKDEDLLPAWIVEDLKRREAEVDNREGLRLPLPEYMPEMGDAPSEAPSHRGVLIISL